MTNVAKVYALSDKAPPDLGEPVGAATVAGWNDALDAIPTDWLDRAFSIAIRAHRGAFMVTFGEVLDAWDSLLQERTRAAQSDPARALPAAATGPCSRCHGAGWLVDRQSGGPGQRAAVMCPACQGGGQDATGTARPTFLVNALLPILRAFTEEHADAVNTFTLIRWALAVKEAGLLPYDLRRMLESTGQPTLYGALTELGITVEPPAPPKPGTVGYWAKVGDAL